MYHITLAPESVRSESRQPSVSRRPANLRAETESVLRDMAYICQLTERVRTAMLAERTPVAEPC